MTITISALAEQLQFNNCVLVLGAGASVPSGAVSAAELCEKIGRKFRIDPESLKLSEVAGLAENKVGRVELVKFVRSQFSEVKAKGALLNLPQYGWKSIFTTNYDQLIEEAYGRAKRPLKVFASNFDFTADADPSATKLFKIHGTIEKDIVDGNSSRLILTEADYDLADDYREALFDRLRSDMAPGTSVVIVGHSLGDTDLRDLVQRAVQMNQRAQSQGKVFVLLYQHDENRAQLLEQRGVRVAFGGLDDFVLELTKRAPDHAVERSDSGSPLDFETALRPVTREVAEERDPSRANSSRIFNGWPCDYPDITGGLTFERGVCSDITTRLMSDGTIVAVLLGASGVGKTTAARQVMLSLHGKGFAAWEHKPDFRLSSKAWHAVAKRLQGAGRKGVLFVDEAHSHLYEVNDLVDLLTSDSCEALKLVLVSTKNHWAPRVKSPSLYTSGAEFSLSQLSNGEIESLLNLVDSVPQLKSLVEAGFGGFSKTERRRRLQDRCEADMFVCMKNIFGSEKYDDIILREYGTLTQPSQDVYRYVSVMEHSGIRVHRQMVMRILGIDANSISALLSGLTDIVHEYEVSAREGIYGWRVRHHVIAGIIAKFKFYDIAKIVELFETVIDNIAPTYDIEIRTIREVCNIESGISVIPDKSVQNRLLRKMMSIAPGERVPRHRLIRNLIELGEFEKAESEIRIFEKDFGYEAPVARYRIQLMIARAVETPGLEIGDRLVILDQARELASSAVSRYELNKYVLGTYCELGVEIFKFAGSHEVFDDAMKALKRAEGRLGDPDVTKMIVRYQRRISSSTGSSKPN